MSCLLMQLVLAPAVALIGLVRNDWVLRLALLTILVLEFGLWSLAVRQRRKYYMRERDFRAAVVQIETAGIGLCLYCLSSWLLTALLPTLAATYVAMFASVGLAYCYWWRKGQWVNGN